ncbi:MICAL-like protein 2a isoform X2 [Takifugu rubripes]|uniref:MICAL-like protein 2a isoform X2 n=1 Tax=Takifugu rubripes TaxID=31033 RepID=UPI0011460EDE|nr:MICAL-like protein 2 isoform X2 [Takifugu rubripes]
MAAIKALEQWCRAHCDGYRDVTITNMTTSFRSGLAFCALIHNYRPDLIDYDSLRKEDVFENNRLAFQVAEEKLGIPALLDAEDMVALKIPDRLSILTYVSQYYNYFNVGGVKRPAENFREAPSGKKNLPVVAGTFMPRPTTEIRLPPAVNTRSSSKGDGVPVETAESGNKSGTLNSKCAACKCHVHLVQRHFVEGKLYHRSCFKCWECSSVLHAGGYRPGNQPGTFVCNQNSCKGSSSVSPGRPSSSGETEPARRPSSVLLAPLRAPVEPVGPSPPSKSWTASAQKTQSARQRFFQADVTTGDATPTELSKEGGTTTVKTLAEENRNNNNKRPFTVRPADRRFGGDPVSPNGPSSRNGNQVQASARRWVGDPSDKECPRETDATGSRPAAVRSDAKVSQRRSNPPPQPKSGAKDAEPEPGSPSAGVATSGLSVAPPPTAAAPVSPVFLPGSWRESSPRHPGPGDTRRSLHGQDSIPFVPPGFKCGSQHPVKPPPRRPAVESISVLSRVPANPGNPPGAKKGKYLSPTDASRTEMRSPSVKPYHVPAEQIERQLGEIETNVARLEKEGVALEKNLRSCEEEGDGDILMDPLMVDWFNLIRKKQMYIRKESELVYLARTQELEQQQPGVEGELRRLLEKPDHLKSREEQRQEERLMQRLVEIVDGRNAIVEGLDEDRLREVEEDQQLNEMMKNLGVKKAKHKRKASISKLFRRRSKRRVE